MAVPLMAMIPFIIAETAMAAVSTIEVNRTHAATFGSSKFRSFHPYKTAETNLIQEILI